MQREKPAYYSLQQAGERKLGKHSCAFPICRGKPDFYRGYQRGEKYIDKTDHSLRRKIIPKPLV